MKNDKQKPQTEPVYTITVELPNRKRATFTYNDFELADQHYVQLQAQQVVGSYGVKSIQRSWRGEK